MDKIILTKQIGKNHAEINSGRSFKEMAYLEEERF